MNDQELISKIEETLSRLLGKQPRALGAAEKAPVPPPPAPSFPILDPSDLLSECDLYSTKLRTKRGLVGMLLAKVRSLSRRVISPFLLKQTRLNRSLLTTLGEWSKKTAKTWSDEMSAIRALAEDTRHELNAVRKESESLRSQREAYAALDDADRESTRMRALDGFLSKLEGVNASTKAAIKAAVTRYAGPAQLLAAYPGQVDPSLLRMRQKYVELIRDGASVVDLSCGGGEFLEILRNEGIRAKGVEEEPALVGECKVKGLDCEEANAADFLKSLGEGELGLIFCSGLPERLSYAAFREVVALALTKLQKDGVLLVEGINPFSAPGEGPLRRDPRNVRAFNPHAMRAVVSAQGFRDVTLEFADPHSGARSEEDFGSPYYLLIARK